MYIGMNDDPQMFIAWGMVIAGLLMLLAGEIGIYGSFRRSWMVMLVVECVNCAIALFVITACMIALILALGFKDPNREFWMKSYALDDGFDYTPDMLTGATAFKRSQWANGACTVDDANAGEPRWVALSGACGAFKTISDTPSVVADFYGNCSNITKATGGDSMRADCQTCVKGCMEETIIIAEDNLGTVTYVVWATFAFLIFGTAYNGFLLAQDWEELKAADVKWKLELGDAVNGAVVVMGLALMAFASNSIYSANAEAVCPNGGCAGVELWGALVISLSLMGIGGVSIFACVTGENKILVTTTICYCAAAFLLLLCSIFLTMVSGFMDTLNSGYDENFSQMRMESNRAIESAGEGTNCIAPKYDGSDCYCPLTEIGKLDPSNGCTSIATAGNQSDNAYFQAVACPYQGADWTKFTTANAKDSKTCKDKMETDLKNDMWVAGLFMIALGGWIAFMIWQTQVAVMVWHASPGESGWRKPQKKAAEAAAAAAE